MAASQPVTRCRGLFCLEKGHYGSVTSAQVWLSLVGRTRSLSRWQPPHCPFNRRTITLYAFAHQKKVRPASTDTPTHCAPDVSKPSWTMVPLVAQVRMCKFPFGRTMAGRGQATQQADATLPVMPWLSPFACRNGYSLPHQSALDCILVAHRLRLLCSKINVCSVYA